MKGVPKRSSKLRVLCNIPNLIALSILIVCVIGGWWLVSQSGVNLSTPASFKQSLNHLGQMGVFAYIGFLVLAIVIGPIPGTPVIIAAGAVWDPIQASLYGATGIYLGSLIAYFIGRTLGRSAVKVLIGKVLYFSKHRGEIYLGWLVFMTHLIPVIPYDLISYSAGISGLSLPIYASSSLLGIVPCTFLLAHLGSAIKVGLPLAIALAILFLAVILILSWGIKRHNWLGLKDVIRLE